MEESKNISEAAKQMSSIGASKGGKTRASNLTPEERKEIAQKAIQARWIKLDEAKGIRRARHGSPDRPLRIGDVEIPCYVLADETRVLSERGITGAFGAKRGGSHWRRRRKEPTGPHLPVYLSAHNLRPYIADELLEVLRSPIKFRTPTGTIAYGLEATLLPKICEVFLRARDAHALHPSQADIVIKADILMRGLAHVGIIALVDEATGFQDARTKLALEAILEKFIAKELRPWIKTFQDEYYKEIFRLNEWEYKPSSVKRPQVIGRWTNDIIYDRLAPGVRAELHRLAERDEKGRLKHKLFQRLTESTGHPKLREHLSAATALMRAADSWQAFKRLLDRALPRFNMTRPLPFPDDEEET
jgi:hypothetical protein